MRYIELKREHVGKAWIRAFGRVWPVSGFLGRVMPQDIGKRVYLNGDILQAENDDQRAARVGTART